MVAVPPLRMRPLKPYCDPCLRILMLWSSCPKLWIENVIVPWGTFSRLSVTLHSRSETPTALPLAAPLQAGETSTNRHSAAASVTRPLIAPRIGADARAHHPPIGRFTRMLLRCREEEPVHDPAPACHLGGRPLGDRACDRLRGRHRPGIRYRRDRPWAPSAGAGRRRRRRQARPRARRDGVGAGRAVGGAAAPDRPSRAKSSKSTPAPASRSTPIRSTSCRRGSPSGMA